MYEIISEPLLSVKIAQYFKKIIKSFYLESALILNIDFEFFISEFTIP